MYTSYIYICMYVHVYIFLVQLVEVVAELRHGQRVQHLVLEVGRARVVQRGLDQKLLLVQLAECGQHSRPARARRSR